MLTLMSWEKCSVSGNLKPQEEDSGSSRPVSSLVPSSQSLWTLRHSPACGLYTFFCPSPHKILSYFCVPPLLSITLRSWKTPVNHSCTTKPPLAVILWHFFGYEKLYPKRSHNSSGHESVGGARTRAQVL